MWAWQSIHRLRPTHEHGPGTAGVLRANAVALMIVVTPTASVKRKKMLYEILLAFLMFSSRERMSRASRQTLPVT